MIITRTFQGKTRTKDLPITPAQYKLWEMGMLAQDAFPHLSADDREFIISGMTAEDWDEAFR